MEIIIKNKTIKYTITEKYYLPDFITGNEELHSTTLISEIYSYNLNLEQIYQEISKKIVSYLIKKIKKYSEN